MHMGGGEGRGDPEGGNNNNNDIMIEDDRSCTFCGRNLNLSKLYSQLNTLHNLLSSQQSQHLYVI